MKKKIELSARCLWLSPVIRSRVGSRRRQIITFQVAWGSWKYSGDKAFENGTAYASAGYEGVCFWLPPGVEADEQELNQAIEKLVPSSLKDEVLAVFEAMDQCHPHEECWYLPLIGVDPAYQGRGLGSILMKHVLNIIDQKGLPAYLESSNPQNISLCERHGFEVIDRIQIGSSPPVHPMLRPAR